MKVAILHFYQGYVDRGVETFIDELGTRLSSKIILKIFQAGPKINKSLNTELIPTPYYSAHPDSQLPPKTLKRRLFLDYFKRREFIFTINAMASLSKFDPDIIMPTDSGWQILIIKLFCLLNKKKLLIVGHSGSGWDDRFNLFVKPDIFVALGRQQGDWASKATPWKNQKIEVIPNGVDLDKFNPQGKKYDINLKKPILLNVAAPSELKNTLNTIRGVAKTKASLLIVGSGDKNSEADKLGEGLLGNRYKRITVPHDRIPEIFRCANAFILPSNKHEAFGIVYLEAMATNIPVVATDDKKRRDIIGEAGVFVKNVESPDSIAKKINEVLTKNFDDIPRKQALKFSWDLITAKYLEIFSNIS